jgi:hypothetical protein
LMQAAGRACRDDRRENRAECPERVANSARSASDCSVGFCDLRTRLAFRDFDVVGGLRLIETTVGVPTVALGKILTGPPSRLRRYGGQPPH